MALGTPTWQIDDPVAGTIRFNTGVPDDDGIEWVLEDADGFWGSSNNNAQLAGKNNQHGSFRTAGYKETLVATLNLVAYARRGDYAAERRARLRVASIGSDPEAPTRVTCESEVGPLYRDLFLSGDILSKTRPAQQPSAEWSVQMTATDPRMYSSTEYVITASLPSPGVGGIDASEPGIIGAEPGIDAGAAPSAGFAILTNAGTAPAIPQLELHGPLDTPVVVTDTGGQIKYNGVLADGDVVYIDPTAPSVFLGTVNRRSLVNPADWSYFRVPSGGTLTIGLSHAGSSTATGFVVARYRDSFF